MSSNEIEHLRRYSLQTLTRKRYAQLYATRSLTVFCAFAQETEGKVQRLKKCVSVCVPYSTPVWQQSAEGERTLTPLLAKEASGERLTRKVMKKKDGETFINHKKIKIEFGGTKRKSHRKKRENMQKKGDRWVNKALVALLGWKRMPLIMRCLFYPPALCLSRCYACFPLAPIISALEPGDNNEFTEIEKCLGLNCMYLVTHTEAMAWERLVSQWHHLATQPL